MSFDRVLLVMSSGRHGLGYAVDGATMHFRFDIASYEHNPKPSFGQKILLLGKLLNSNKGHAQRINLVKLLLAVVLG
jgi:hypothetical protein